MRRLHLTADRGDLQRLRAPTTRRCCPSSRCAGTGGPVTRSRHGRARSSGFQWRATGGTAPSRVTQGRQMVVVKGGPGSAMSAGKTSGPRRRKHLAQGQITSQVDMVRQFDSHSTDLLNINTQEVMILLLSVQGERVSAMSAKRLRQTVQSLLISDTPGHVVAEEGAAAKPPGEVRRATGRTAARRLRAEVVGCVRAREAAGAPSHTDGTYPAGRALRVRKRRGHSPTFRRSHGHGYALLPHSSTDLPGCRACSSALVPSTHPAL